MHIGRRGDQPVSGQRRFKRWGQTAHRAGILIIAITGQQKEQLDLRLFEIRERTHIWRTIFKALNFFSLAYRLPDLLS